MSAPFVLPPSPTASACVDEAHTREVRSLSRDEQQARRVGRTAAACAVLCVALAGSALAQESATRAEELRKRREQKASDTRPYEPGKIERWLIKIENDKVLEGLITPGDGFYPRLGSFHSGGGLAAGPGYRKRNLFGVGGVFTASTAVSYKKYWIAEATLDLRRLASGLAFAEAHARREHLPQEDFFGLGPGSLRPNRVSFLLENTAIGASGGVHVTPWLAAGAGADYLAPRVGRGRDPRFPSIEQRFSDVEVPGLARQPDFVTVRTFLDLNYRKPIDNPRTGGRYRLTYQRFADLDLDRYSFGRLDIELEQYLPFLEERRVLALHALASMSDTDSGNEVPFYLQRVLGGSHTLRGFRNYRFRDRNLLLIQAEYRFEVFPALDAALFYDTGKVATSRRDLDLDNLESDYGFGFRFGTQYGVFMRIDAAFGSREGKHFFLRWSHVF